MLTVVVGGGASGLMASYTASKKGNKVILLEKNEKLGKKIYITGKGRCNVTNNVLPNDFLNSVVTNKKFLFSAINVFSSQDLIYFFENNGCSLKTERGNRVFPCTEHASDITKCFEKLLLKQKVDIRLNTVVLSVEQVGNKLFKINTDKGVIECNSVIICTGGISYPLTGSNGDGYRFAKNMGHKIQPLRPSLCGLNLKGNDFASSQGLSLKNVRISIKQRDKLLYTDFGEMLFTHFGVSGPIILSASCHINKVSLEDTFISIDLKPALDERTLENRLLREFSDNQNKEISNLLRALIPKGLINLVLRRACISASKRVCEITKVQRTSLIAVLKNLTFQISSLRPIEEAIVTSGGVCVDQINPKTMESKLVNGLYFAGEVIDVDAYTGGFNLQIAFSTGYLAGQNC